MIIGILILIFIGRSFYVLATKHERKNAWVYPIVGIASYYGGIMVGGFIIGLVMAIMGEELDEAIIVLGAIPVGVGFCWGLYAILKRNWKKQNNVSPDVLDDNI